MISKKKHTGFLLFTLYILFFSFSPIFSLPSCKKNDSSCIEKEKAFRLADKELNDIYRSIQKKLASSRKDDLKKGSLEWISYKEYLCNYDLENRTQKQEADVSYFDCLFDLTVSRTKYLKNVYDTTHSTNIQGTYNDGVGGNLQIEKKNNNFLLSISVVRGPTFHTGEVKGPLIIKERKAIFELNEDGQHCSLTIVQKNVGIDIVEKDCADFHGARAYFTGLYRKIKD